MILPRTVKCANCYLPIEPGQEVVRLEPDEMVGRVGRIRYRHATYEACSAAEAEVARWD